MVKNWIAGALITLCVVGGLLYVNHKTDPDSSHYRGRGSALLIALSGYFSGTPEDRVKVAQAIAQNFEEDRSDAVNWSLIYWGCVGVAAAASAMAATVLKLESVGTSDKIKKDIAAILSVLSAILVALSTSGRYQEKWQANRLAAAEIEQIGYEFLARDGADARNYYVQLKDVQYARAIAIVGKQGNEKKETGAATPQH